MASLSLAPILLLYLRFNLSLKFSYLLFTLAWISSLNHVLLDSLTRGGVPLFYPLSKRKHSHFPLIGGRLRLPNS
ncbi:MAG: metal-dependent hydrolase, partial [Candidatus Methanofastidiosia archaeon]